MDMETYYQNQGYAGHNNYGNNCTGCHSQATQNTLKRNQVSVEQYNPNLQQVSQGQQSGQGSPEQPPMPPEAEAALSQLKNMPCPKKYFPSSMLNSNLPNAPQCNWSSGSNNAYSLSNSMFSPNSMHDGGSFQNPHAANNAQLHAQNFQLHQELHGMGRSSQGDFQSAMSNSQRQHALNPQLHAQNFTMHQNLHGVGKPGNQGPQHSQAPQSGKNSTGNRKFKYQPPANQQQAPQAGHVNYNNYQYPQNYSNPYTAMPGTQHDMSQYSMGQQSMAQNPMSNNSIGQNAFNQQSTETNQHPAGQHSTDPHSGYHSMGHYSSNQHSVNPHSMGHYSTGQQSMNGNSITQYSTPNNYAGSHHTHGYTHEDMAAHTMPHYSNNSSAYQHTHETDNKFHYHMPQQTTDHYHTHSEDTQQSSNETSHYPTQNNYTMSDVGPTSRDTLSVCRQDSSRQIQEILCSEPEPHFSVVQRSKGNHEMAKFNERNVSDGGEVYSIKPCVHHEESYPAQHNRMYNSVPNIHKMVPVNQEKSNGLQGVRSSQACSPKSWVIGPPAKKTRQDWMKHYA